MGYFSNLSQEQKDNIALIVEDAKKNGITNDITIAGILAIVSKESNFVPKSENLNYSAGRLQQVFGISSSKAKQIEGNEQEIGNAIYGGKFGNGKNEGYKYRGRGFNQLTFKSNYEKYGKLIGEDLVRNPDKANDPKIASKILIAYNKDRIDALIKNGKLQEYNANDINDFKTTKDAAMAFYHATAGVGKNVSSIKNLENQDSIGGMTKALARVNELLEVTKTFAKKAGQFVKKNPIKTIAITVLLGVLVGVGIYFITKKKKK
jgi:predicted chitinase